MPSALEFLNTPKIRFKSKEFDFTPCRNEIYSQKQLMDFLLLIQIDTFLFIKYLPIHGSGGMIFSSLIELIFKIEFVLCAL